ncbi:lysophospholipid acyltransferase family protein [Stappia sp. ES.058]|uniref:lysophospholipid acyltransferase family protein n=1 Tax=Stappia sp. ES.058 TaxID=1881061 RepID=UPI00087968BA|nr:lysophospholipid acyltransferase family protein [Stappia sp. ES.058]SDU21809.1 Putative hemolysin [Stappia sp. ES.058]
MTDTELSYANPEHPWVKRSLIRAIETLSGRSHLLGYYRHWRDAIAASSAHKWSDLLSLVGVNVVVAQGSWPPEAVPDGPLVMIANHPYGLSDGLAVLSLAERLNRPYRILINNELLKAPEIRPYALPIDFEETEAALRTNMKTRQEALRLLREGVTIIVFPGGGVATADRPFGRARELPWKTFTAKMIRASQATVLPLHFEGQNSPLFHIVSRYSLTLRLSMYIREFRRLMGRDLSVRIGAPIPFEALAAFGDQRAMIAHLHECVLALAPVETDTKDGRRRRGR